MKTDIPDFSSRIISPWPSPADPVPRSPRQITGQSGKSYVRLPPQNLCISGARRSCGSYLSITKLRTSPGIDLEHFRSDRGPPGCSLKKVTFFLNFVHRTPYTYPDSEILCNNNRERKNPNMFGFFFCNKIFDNKN